MSIRAKLLIIVVVQTAVLIAMIGIKQWTLNMGTEVVLETTPIDPRSLFRGDYVRLGYKAGTLRAEDFPKVAEVKRHDRVYVVLKKGEPFWQPEAIHLEWPEEMAQGRVVLRGEVEHISDTLWNPQTRKPEKIKHIQVRYGIENYFVPEGKGRELEQPREGETVSILLAVDSCGRAGIKAVLVNGKPRYAEKLL
ncbi:MAG: GDYXXLXY domain-containing protein [Mariprofundaceae bacterium]